MNWDEMKFSRSDAFKRNAQFARNVAELVCTPTARDHWLAIAEFWAGHCDAAAGQLRELQKPPDHSIADHSRE